MNSRRSVRLIICVVSIIILNPNIIMAYEKGLIQGSLELYLDGNGGPNACATGIYLGRWSLETKNRQLDFNLRWPEADLNPWFLHALVPYTSQEIKSQIRDPKSTLCARYDNLLCYRGKHPSGSGYLIGPCTSEEIAKWSLKDVVHIGGDSVRITINGANIKVEPMEACCSPDGTCKQVLWQQPSNCPKNTKSPGKATNCYMCNTIGIPLSVPPDKPPDQKQAEQLGCCLPNGKCDNVTPEVCDMLNGKPLNRRCLGHDKFNCKSGACIVGDDCIDPITEDYCTNKLKGIYQGNDSTCPQEEEEKEKGCCLPDGKCDNMPPTQCNVIYGRVLPGLCKGEDDPACTEFTGACMVGEKCVPSQTEDSCRYVKKGEYQGDGSKCPPPESPKSVCCVAGTCGLKTKEECRDEDGTFKPELKSCDPDPCKKEPDQSKGGCCYGYGTCIDGVLEAKCREEEGKTFFPGGCPEECPTGACYSPCPTASDKEDCFMTSENKCATIPNSRFELDEKCIDTGCLNCERCQIAVGKWVFNLPNENATLTLNDDCTSHMIIKKQVDENTSGLPITSPKQRTMDGIWGCSDQTIRIEWVEGAESTLIMLWEDRDLKLCYPDGEKTICAERYREVGEVTVKKKGIYQGTKE